MPSIQPAIMFAASVMFRPVQARPRRRLCPPLICFLDLPLRFEELMPPTKGRFFSDFRATTVLLQVLKFLQAGPI